MLFSCAIYGVHGFRPFYHGMIFMLQNHEILENHICLFYVENAIEMRKERNGDEYKEI